MKNRLILSCLCVIFATSFKNLKAQNMTENIQPPVAKIIPKTLEKHGDKRIDNYYWLNERENPEVIDYLFSNLIPKYPNIEFGAHLHTTPDKWFEKIDAAYNAGCRRYDGAIQGFGGCPMAKDDLTGNMPTEKLLSYFTTKRENTNTSPMSFESAYNEATKLFGEFH